MKAHFSNIQQIISDHIAAAKTEILVAVAWFTNTELLQYLTERAAAGVEVKVLVSNDLINARTDFSALRKAGGLLLIYEGDRFLHEKFALFDQQKLLAGSYNWTRFAEYKNYENLLETNHDTLLKQFAGRFKKLWGEAALADADRFTGRNSEGFEVHEEAMRKLEAELEREILETLEYLLKLGVKISKSIVLDMIHRYGAVGACRKVVEKGNDDQHIPSGFIKLVEAGKMHESFEYRMTREKYRRLFPQKSLDLAEERLRKFER